MFAFIILHYLDEKSTEKCIKSILDNTYEPETKIIVVDNASNNGSIEYLKASFSLISNIAFITNNQNLGYSRGNNIGIKYAKQTFNPDFYIVLNNDTFITDRNIEDKIKDEYIKNEYDICAPIIWNCKRHYNQNPFYVISSYSELEKKYKQLLVGKKILDSYLPIFYYFYNKLPFYKIKYEKGIFGAAIIFTKKYVHRFCEPYPEITFLYFEEFLLNQRIKEFSLKIQYSDNIKVFHNHSSSTKKISKNNIMKWKFQNKEMINAIKAIKNKDKKLR